MKAWYRTSIEHMKKEYLESDAVFDMCRISELIMLLGLTREEAAESIKRNPTKTEKTFGGFLRYVRSQTVKSGILDYANIVVDGKKTSYIFTNDKTKN